MPKEEIKAVLEDSPITPNSDGPKTVSKSASYHIKKNYDGKTELPDPKQEEYIYRIIANLGNRVKAYNETYYPGVEKPSYSPNMPYRFFERKGFQLRYQYLMQQAMFSAGLDRRSLLLKASTLVDESLKKKSVRDFSTMVDTILKLETPVTQTRNERHAPAAQKIDTAKIKALMKDLEG